MAIKRFEDIIAWQKAQDWAVVIYADFIELKDYTFRKQICSAVISISNNIAEGFDRSSNPEFIRFLYYALASCSEVKSMIYLAERLKYCNFEQMQAHVIRAEEIAKIIRGLIKSLQSQRVLNP